MTTGHDREQCIRRAETVSAYRLIAPGTVEEKTLEPPQGELLQPVLHPLAGFSRNFTFEAGKTGESLGSWFHK